jgi:sec-independent protein translocase protein TatA
MSLGPAEIGLIVLALMLLFGYRKLPDASRSLGRSLRMFKCEVEGLKEGDRTPSPHVAPALESAPSSTGGESRTPRPEGTRS